MVDPATLSVYEAAVWLTQGRVSAEELTAQCLAKIDQLDGDLRAFITVEADQARQRAREVDAEIQGGQRKGPLHGIPIGVKDNFSVAGGVTTMGSAIHRDNVTDEDAGVVERLDAAGAVRIGKTNLHEYALGVTTENPYFGICRNPWDRSRTPGGSSGGSAVAVATGMALAAIGSDTSGSIRIPAAACGIVGLKPTYGRISSFGCYPEAWTLDHVGVLARSARDAALVLDAVSGHDPRVSSSLGLPASTAASELDQSRPLRVGVEEAFFFHDVDPEVEAIIRQTLDDLRESGVLVQPVALPSLRDAIFALTVIDTAETTAFHDAQFRQRPQDYGDDVRVLIESGALPSAVDYVQAQQIRARVRADFQRAFTQVDVIASPTLPIQTPRIGEPMVVLNGRTKLRDLELMRLVGPPNLAGLPAVSVPCGELHGLPVAMQLIGPALDEATVLRAAAAVETMRGRAN